MNQPYEIFPEPTSWANVQHVKCFLFQLTRLTTNLSISSALSLRKINGLPHELRTFLLDDGRKHYKRQYKTLSIL